MLGTGSKPCRTRRLQPNGALRLHRPAFTKVSCAARAFGPASVRRS